MHHVTSLAASQTMDHLQDVRLRQLYTVILDCTSYICTSEKRKMLKNKNTMKARTVYNKVRIYKMLKSC